MGADYEGQEKAVEILKQMPVEAKEYLFHHIGNSMNVVVNALWLMERAMEAGQLPEAEHFDMAIKAAHHAMDDVRKIG